MRIVTKPCEPALGNLDLQPRSLLSLVRIYNKGPRLREFIYLALHSFDDSTKAMNYSQTSNLHFSVDVGG